MPLVSVPLALFAALYLAGARAVARRHPARPWPRSHTAAFLAGLAAIAVAIQGSDGVYDDVLLHAHMVQHLLLIVAAPPLPVYGRPPIFGRYLLLLAAMPAGIVTGATLMLARPSAATLPPTCMPPA